MLIGSKSEVFCFGRELDVKSIGVVIEGLNSKGPVICDGTEEKMKFSFEHHSNESRSIRGPFDGTVEHVCNIHASSVKVSHHLRQSQYRNRFCETTGPKPALGQWSYLECVMDCFTTVHTSKGFRQFLNFSNRSGDCLRSIT